MEGVRPLASGGLAARRKAPPAVRLLLVEDSPGDARLVQESLRRAGDTEFQVIRAGLLEEALRAMEADRFDAILLDLALPDASGLETFDAVAEAARGTPVIVLSGLRDEAMAIEAVQRGAQDYLIKGQNGGGRLSRAIRYAIERSQATREIQRLAFHDGLTGLPNRRLFQYALGRAVARARRSDETLALLYLDLDNLKNVNDTLGHKAGDELLKVAARRLGDATRESDTVARIGGDEFALVCPGIAGPRDARVLAGKILDSLRVPFRFQGRKLTASASLGIALYPGDGRDPETLLRHGDAAMYQAKERGGDRLHFHASGTRRPDRRRVDPAEELAGAIGRGELSLKYQPQMDLRTGSVVGLEALVRWSSPALGRVPPVELIRMAERTGHIDAIGTWVLRAACRQARAWQLAGIPPFRLAVNLSLIQLRRGDLAGEVRRTLVETGLEPGCLELELTGGIPHDAREAQAVLRELKSLGVRLALDDFGRGRTGFSSLKTCPLDTVKIDPLFVAGIGTGSPDESLLAAIIDVVHELGLSVTAEGVEKAGQAAFLLGKGCDGAQGHYFCPPLTAEEAGLLLARRREPAGGGRFLRRLPGVPWRPAALGRSFRRFRERRSHD